MMPVIGRSFMFSDIRSSVQKFGLFIASNNLRYHAPEYKAGILTSSP